MGHDTKSNASRLPLAITALFVAGMIAFATPVSAQAGDLAGQASGAVQVAGDVASATGSADLDTRTAADAAAEAQVADALAAVASMEAAGPDAIAASAAGDVTGPVGMLVAADSSTHQSASADVNPRDGIDVSVFHEGCAAAELNGGMDFVTSVASGPLAASGSTSAATELEEICNTLDYDLQRELPDLETEAEADAQAGDKTPRLLAKAKAAWSGFLGLF